MGSAFFPRAAWRGEPGVAIVAVGSVNRGVRQRSARTFARGLMAKGRVNPDSAHQTVDSRYLDALSAQTGQAKVIGIPIHVIAEVVLHDLHSMLGSRSMH